MKSNSPPAGPMESGQRRPYRAPTGLPEGRENYRMGSTVSVLLHLLVVLAILFPLAANMNPLELAQGAGGPGPAGGGGGGNRGSGAPNPEQIRFVTVAPAVEAPAPVLKVVPPPVKQPEPPPPQPKPEVKAETPPPAPTMPVGTGGGTGTDNTSGSGPGTGGGVGTGVGTGRGSSIGPGTGGGNQANYPPTPIEVFIPPLPVPSSVKGFHLIAEFDIDERGTVMGLTFTQTRDRGYNHRLEDILKGFRFRPGTTPDGTPVRMKAQVVVDLY